MAVQIRRGTDAERAAMTPATGELIYTTDTKKLWVGDGATAGGVVAGGGAGLGGSNTYFTTFGGTNAGAAMTTGNNSTFIGYGVGSALTTTNYNAFAGVKIGTYLTSGTTNTLFGSEIYGQSGQISAERVTAFGFRNFFDTGRAVNAGSLIVGKKYVITTPGNTTWTAVGAPGNSAGAAFVATGAGSGTGVAATSVRNSVAMGYNTLKMMKHGTTVAVGTNVAAAMIYGDNNALVGGSACELALAVDFNTVIGHNSLLDVSTSTTAANLVPYAMYTIMNAGDTDWVACGAANNLVGTIFTCSAAGSGTGTAAAYASWNTGVGYRAGAGVDNQTTGASPVNSCKTGRANTFIGSRTAPLTANDENCIVIGESATGLGSNTIMIGNTTTTGLTKVAGKLLIDKKPTTAVGSYGDLAGMIASDANYIYHCNADYDGATSIWGRVSVSTW